MHDEREEGLHHKPAHQPHVFCSLHPFLLVSSPKVRASPPFTEGKWELTAELWSVCLGG